MKKKIINGILMAALMLTATTSFVSCKDNVDDELVQVYDNLAKQKTSLETKINDLETKLQTQINTLGEQVKQNADEIKKLQNEIKSMKDELAEINEAITSLQGEVSDLKKRMDAIEDRVDALEELFEEAIGSIITDIYAEHTVNHVFGSMNIPGFNMLSLAAFYGDNQTGIEEFPTTDIDMIVDQDRGTVLDDVDIAGADKYTFKPTITQPHGNAGKLFFTVNSVDYEKFDISDYVLTLEGSNGNVAPITFSDIKPSSFDIQWGIYKSEEVASITEPTVKNGFFEAEATIADADLDATKFNLKKFIDLKSLKNELKLAKQNIQSKEGKKAVLKQVAKEALQILINFYSGKMSANNTEVNNPSYRPQRLVISKQMEDGSLKRMNQTELKIAASAVAPLSYKSFWQLENNAKYIDLDLVYRALNKFKNKVKEYLPNTSDINIPVIKEIDLSGSKAYVWAADDDTGASAAWVALPEEIQDAINNGLQIDDLNDALQDLSKVTDVGSSVDKAADAIKNYLQKGQKAIYNALHNHILTRAVAPIVLFKGKEGIDRLHYGITVRGNQMQILMTSSTEELLVPAFAKYIAVVQNGKVLQQATVPGSTQSWTLNFPSVGSYYVVLSAVDYYGNVVNKKYLVKVI